MYNKTETAVCMKYQGKRQYLASASESVLWQLFENFNQKREWGKHHYGP